METVSGGCLCQTIRFEIDLPTLFCGHCHCSMCRRAHGAGVVTWFGIPYDRFRVVAGASHLLRYRSSDHGTRSFCGTCGSSLFCESTRHPDYLDIVLANMDAPIDRTPEFHVYKRDEVPWLCVTDALPSLPVD